MTTQELEYLVKVNDRDLAELKGRVRDVNKSLGDETHAASSKGALGLGKLGGAAKLAALGFAGAGIGSLAGAAKIGWDEFQQGQAVAAQTTAVLKSTGGAAGVTAGHISNLAGALLKKSGVDDEAIQSGQNLLLTFTNIRNEAGKGNDIFDQTTKTMLDMSVALGQDTKSSAIQLGKALNDPIKGVTALQRVGVSFTQAQKDQIKALVESGNAMGAQKLILGELNKEFGGSAEAAGKTLPGQLNVLKETFSNVAGEAVGAVVPALTSVLGGIVAQLPAIESWVQGIAGKLMPIFRAWWSYIQADLLPIIQSLRAIFTAAVSKIVGVLEQNKPQLTEIWRNVRTLLDGVAHVLQATVIPVLRFALTEVLPTAIAIALPVLSKLSLAFKLVGAIVDAGAGAVDGVRSMLVKLAGYVSGAWHKVTGALTGPIEAAKGVFGGFLGIINSIVSALEHVMDVAGKASGILGKVGGVLGHIPGFAEGVTGFRGGLAIVGENGPELVRLPAGSDVIPNQKVGGYIGGPRALAGGGGGVLELHVHIGTVIGNSLEAAARELTGPILSNLKTYQAQGGSLSPTF